MSKRKREIKKLRRQVALLESVVDLLDEEVEQKNSVIDTLNDECVRYIEGFNEARLSWIETSAAAHELLTQIAELAADNPCGVATIYPDFASLEVLADSIYVYQEPNPEPVDDPFFDYQLWAAEQEQQQTVEPVQPFDPYGLELITFDYASAPYIDLDGDASLDDDDDAYECDVRPEDYDSYWDYDFDCRD